MPAAQPQPLPRDPPEGFGYFLTTRCHACKRTATKKVSHPLQTHCGCGGMLMHVDAWCIADAVARAQMIGGVK